MSPQNCGLGVRPRALAVGVALLVSAPALASNFSIDWLSMSPVPYSNPVPSGSNFFLPGVGSVNVTHNIPGSWNQSRSTDGAYQNGTVTNGADTYAWGAHEFLSVENLTPSVPPVPTSWSVTYTFSGAQAPGTIIVCIGGLGRTSDFGGIATQATVNQSGTFLGDWNSGQGFGASLFFGGAGSFTMMNSTSGPGTNNPWWNTDFGLVRIDDPISSLTVHFSQYPGDGVGVNIGVIPTPSSLALLASGGLVALRRRR